VQSPLSPRRHLPGGGTSATSHEQWMENGATPGHTHSHIHTARGPSRIHPAAVTRGAVAQQLHGFSTPHTPGWVLSAHSQTLSLIPPVPMPMPYRTGIAHRAARKTHLVGLLSLLSSHSGFCEFRP